MTSHKAQIQALINEIDEVLSKPSPRLPWVMAGDADQQRQVLEQTRRYLLSLQQDIPEPGSPALPSSPLAYNLAYPQGQAPAVESAQQVLQAVLQEMSYLRANVMQPLRNDVEQLQLQREALLQEVRMLEAQRQQALPPAQSQQQIITEFLQSLMGRLQENLTGQVAQMVASLEAQSAQERALLGSTPLTTEVHPETGVSYQPVLSAQQRLEQIQTLQSQSDQLLLKLDSTLRVIFESLQSNIQSYQDSLSQGLDKMHNLGQQGEAMFAALVNRLAQQLGREASTYLQSSLQTTDWAATGRPLPAVTTPEDERTPSQITQGSPFVLDMAPVTEDADPASNDPIDLLLNELQSDEPATIIQPPTTSIQPPAPTAINLDDIDLDNLDLEQLPTTVSESANPGFPAFEVDDDITFFQVDQPLTSFQVSDDDIAQLEADLDSAVDFAEGEMFVEPELEGDSTLDLLNQLSAELQSDEPGSSTETTNTEPVIISPDQEGYDDEMSELYESLFGSTAIQADPSDPDVEPVDQHVADAGQESLDSVEQDSVAGIAEDTSRLDFSELETFEPIVESERSPLEPSVETEFEPPLTEGSEALVDELFGGLADPAHGTGITAAEDEIDQSSTDPLENLLGESLALESLAVGDSVSGWQDEVSSDSGIPNDVDVITSLSDLITAPKSESAIDPAEISDDVAGLAFDEDTFVPAAPDEILLVSEEDLTPDAPVDLGDTILSQLTNDLSNLEDQFGDASPESDLLEPDLLEPDQLSDLPDLDLSEADLLSSFHDDPVDDISDHPQPPQYDASLLDEELQPPVDLFDEIASEEPSQVTEESDFGINDFEVDADQPITTEPPTDWQSLLDNLTTAADPVVSPETTPEELFNTPEQPSETNNNDLFELSPDLQDFSFDESGTPDLPPDSLTDEALLDSLFAGAPVSEADAPEDLTAEPVNPLIQETAFLDTLFSDQPVAGTTEDRDEAPPLEQPLGDDVASEAESSNQPLINSLSPELLNELFSSEATDAPVEPAPSEVMLDDLFLAESIDAPAEPPTEPPSPVESLPPASAALLATDTALPSVSIPLDDDATLDDVFVTVPPLPATVDDALTPPTASSEEMPLLDDLFGGEVPIDIAAVDLPSSPSPAVDAPAPDEAIARDTSIETLSGEANAFTLEGLAESLFEDAPSLAMGSSTPTFQPESEDWTLEGAFGDLGQAPPLPPELGSELPTNDLATAEDIEKKKTLASETNSESVAGTSSEAIADPGSRLEIGAISSTPSQSSLDDSGSDASLDLAALALDNESDNRSDRDLLAGQEAMGDTDEFALPDAPDVPDDLDFLFIDQPLDRSAADLPTADRVPDLATTSDVTETDNLVLDHLTAEHPVTETALETSLLEFPEVIPSTPTSPDVDVPRVDTPETDAPTLETAIAPEPVAPEPDVTASLPELDELELDGLELDDLELDDLELDELGSESSIPSLTPTSDLRTDDLQASELLELSEDLGIDAQELKALLETDFASEEFSPPPPFTQAKATPKVWYLGVDFGTTGISAVLLNRVTLELYPLYWSTEPSTQQQFRLPTLVYLSSLNRPASTPDFAMDFMGQNNLVAVTFPAAHQGSGHPSIMVDSAKQLLRDFKPYLNVGIPHYSPETAQWEPVLQWSSQPLSLSAVHQAVRTLLSTLSISEIEAADASAPTCAALGLEQNTFQTALRQLAGVIVGCPVGWADTYSFNIREAILGAHLVNRPDQIFVVEDAIATLLSELPSADARPLKLPQGVANPDLEDMEWEGATLIINAGATVTDMALVNLPRDLQTLSYQDFYLRSLPYAGNALDQDIICHLIYPAWLKRSPQANASGDNTPLNYTFGSGNGAKSGRFVDGWNWQPNEADPANESIWRNLGLDNLSFPLVGEPDVQNRFALQQRLTSSPLGQGLLEAARHLKLVLQQQDRFVLQLGDQQVAIARQDLASSIFLPYIQRLNRELNALLNQTGTAALNINQVVCTGGTASLAAIARWLPQKFPNATILQDTYGGDRASSPFSDCLPVCSRVAYGLATLPLHPNVLDLARQQYSPYFLLLELLRAFPDQPLSVGAVMQLLERRGINTQVCHQQILSLLEGQLPPGLVPTEKYAYLLTRESAQNPDYRLLLSAPLFSKQGSQTYRLNYDQWNHFRRYLGTLMTSTYQKLAEPLALSLSL
ncbi:hypothetical protein H6G89_08440 [Oscillatoria sp. FACHB-1407]|uniref:hypothetical protein n=1 Tax=Oscillatoria sp. FACHB-1407 TaxID=2692847 RepID=UPI001687CE4C|nr:hypothetical protein [Oscillatoria sp. FACHB-1407]MBD2461068.1 hypothetical protein [Oscillatoria sp. FACHB-1407]